MSGVTKGRILLTTPGPGSLVSSRVGFRVFASLRQSLGKHWASEIFLEYYFRTSNLLFGIWTDVLIKCTN